MKQNVIVICPANDEYAKQAAGWADAVCLGPPGTDISIRCLKGAEVTRNAVDAAIANADAIVYFGHGDWRKLFGSEDLIDIANISLVSGKVIIAIACKSARELGREAVDVHGVAAYLGFSHEVWFLPDQGDPQRLFAKAFGAAASVWFNGGTPGEAAEAMRRGFEDVRVYFSTIGRSHPDSAWARAIAWHNKRYTVVHEPRTMSLAATPNG